MMNKNWLVGLVAVAGLSAALVADPMDEMKKKAEEAAKQAAEKAKQAATDLTKKGEHGAQPQIDPKVMMENMAKAEAMNQPGDGHKIIAGFAGTWNAAVKFWMPGQSEPMPSKGTMVATLIHGGRFLKGEYTGAFSMPGPDGKMMDMPFTGMMTWGYNTAAKQYESFWCDSMTTTPMHSKGTISADGKVITSLSESTAACMMTGGVETVKTTEIMTWVNADTYTMEMWMESPSTPKMKAMEITYTRAAAATPAAPAATLAPATKIETPKIEEVKKEVEKHVPAVPSMPK